MTDELARVHRFEREIELAGTKNVPSPIGFGVITPSCPLRHDSNFVFVERDVAPEMAIAETDRILGGAGYGHRVIVTFDDGASESAYDPTSTPSTGGRCGTSSWCSAEPRRRAPTSRSVKEVDQSALRPGRTAGNPRASLGARPEVAEQLLDSKLLIGQRAETRFFGVEVDGRDRAWTDLYVGQGVAQIEDVATLPEAPRQGVRHGRRPSRRRRRQGAGADLVFLVADDDDWPKELYGGSASTRSGASTSSPNREVTPRLGDVRNA